MFMRKLPNFFFEKGVVHLLPLVVIAVILVSIPVTVRLALQNQQIRSFAKTLEDEGVSLPFEIPPESPPPEQLPAPEGTPQPSPEESPPPEQAPQQPYCSDFNYQDCAYGCEPDTGGGRCKEPPPGATPAPIEATPHCNPTTSIACLYGCEEDTSGGHCKPAPQLPTPYCSDFNYQDCAYGCEPTVGGGECKEPPPSTPLPQQAQAQPYCSDFKNRVCDYGCEPDGNGGNCKEPPPPAATPYCSTFNARDCAYGCEPTLDGGNCKGPQAAAPSCNTGNCFRDCLCENNGTGECASICNISAGPTPTPYIPGKGAQIPPGLRETPPPEAIPTSTPVPPLPPEEECNYQNVGECGADGCTLCVKCKSGRFQCGSNPAAPERVLQIVNCSPASEECSSRGKAVRCLAPSGKYQWTEVEKPCSVGPVVPVVPVADTLVKKVVDSLGYKRVKCSDGEERWERTGEPGCTPRAKITKDITEDYLNTTNPRQERTVLEYYSPPEYYRVAPLIKTELRTQIGENKPTEIPLIQSYYFPARIDEAIFNKPKGYVETKVAEELLNEALLRKTPQEIIDAAAKKPGVLDKLTVLAIDKSDDDLFTKTLRRTEVIARDNLSIFPFVSYLLKPDEHEKEILGPLLKRLQSNK